MSPASAGESFITKPSGKPRPYLLVSKTRRHRPQRCVRITRANAKSTRTGATHFTGSQACSASTALRSLRLHRPLHSPKSCGSPHLTQLPRAARLPTSCTHQHGSRPGNAAVNTSSHQLLSGVGASRQLRCCNNWGIQARCKGNQEDQERPEVLQEQSH